MSKASKPATKPNPLYLTSPVTGAPRQKCEQGDVAGSPAFLLCSDLTEALGQNVQGLVLVRHGIVYRKNWRKTKDKPVSFCAFCGAKLP